MVKETDAFAVKGLRLRAAAMKRLARKLPDRSDRRASKALALSLLQQANEVERLANPLPSY